MIPYLSTINPPPNYHTYFVQNMNSTRYEGALKISVLFVIIYDKL